MAQYRAARRVWCSLQNYRAILLTQHKVGAHVLWTQDDWRGEGALHPSECIDARLVTTPLQEAHRCWDDSWDHAASISAITPCFTHQSHRMFTTFVKKKKKTLQNITCYCRQCKASQLMVTVTFKTSTRRWFLCGGNSIGMLGSVMALNLTNMLLMCWKGVLPYMRL